MAVISVVATLIPEGEGQPSTFVVAPLEHLLDNFQAKGIIVYSQDLESHWIGLPVCLCFLGHLKMSFATGFAA